MTGAHNRVAVLHGVNLDALGRRDPGIYGSATLAQLEQRIKGWARELALETVFFQSNSEGEFVEFLHRVPELADAAIVNAGSWTHYSWAIRDALEIAGVPTVEVHLSDISAREEWRKHSVFEGLVLDAVYGKGAEGYREALRILQNALDV